jgi:hypothetical protein
MDSRTERSGARYLGFRAPASVPKFVTNGLTHILDRGHTDDGGCMTKTNGWLEVDIKGLRKTYERKDKVSALHELIQNAWDENATWVDVTLTPPKNGKSTLTCTDNSPDGYADLSAAHTMYKESYKKGDATKRGRFNVGDKFVLSLCDEAQVTSTSGQVIFQRNGQRKVGTERTKKGSEFWGMLDLTQ